MAGADFSIVGANKLKILGKALKESGDTALWKATQKALADAAKPVKDEIAQSALRTLPKRGGLAQWVAEAKTVTKVQLHGRSVGVRIMTSQAKGAAAAHRKRQAKKRLKAAGRKQVIREGTVFGQGQLNLRRLDRGRAKHPTFGHRPWVLQDVRPGFWTNVVRGPLAVRVRREMVTQIDAVMAELARKIRRAA